MFQFYQKTASLAIFISSAYATMLEPVGNKNRIILILDFYLLSEVFTGNP